MTRSLLLRCWWCFFVVWVAEVVIHYFVIYPYLKSRGIHPALRWYRHFISADEAAYKMARSSAGEPLTWWYVVRAMRILVYLLVIGWLYLLWSR